MKKYIIISASAANLKTVPPITPTSEPNPTRTACFNSLPIRISAATEPAKGPIMIPKGPNTIIPNIVPTAAPKAACLLPPYFLVLTEDAIKSTIKITAITSSCITKNQMLKPAKPVMKPYTNIPAKISKTPGNAGSIVPIIPIININIAMIKAIVFKYDSFGFPVNYSYSLIICLIIPHVVHTNIIILLFYPELF